MLDNKGFDLWAEGYDKSVEEVYESQTYPFVGYKEILNDIYKQVLESKAKRVLDIGFGTAILTSQLYDKGCEIYGQDFSKEMLRLAQEKMPHACLYQGDISMGLVNELKNHKYDAIIATYSLHHLDDKQKVLFIKSLVPLLNQGASIYIGDVAFENNKDLEACKEKEKEYWDDEEFYFVYDQMKTYFPDLSFKKYSYCSAVLTITK